ncbi:MAG: hypothetical protein AAF805_11585 [Planctomycetota bacterium]
MRTCGKAPIIVSALFASVAATAIADTDPLRVYRIGNSLTWDSHPPSIDATSQSASQQTDSGYHVRCASSLATIASDTSTCVAPTTEGVWQDALDGYAWDVVVVQPFASGNANLQSDVQSVLTFRAEANKNAANADAEWFLYQSWPRNNPGSADGWGQWFAAATNQTKHRQAYYDSLQQELLTNGLSTTVIPSADVFRYVWQNADRFDGVTGRGSLYRDAVHGSNIGRLVAGTTVLTTLLGEDLTGAPDEYTTGLSRAELDALQTAVWQVTNTVLRPGDFDGSLAVTSADHAAWVADFGGTWARSDANRDGVVDAADYTVWRDALPAAAPTPEPGAALLATTAAVAVILRRRPR